jgi:mevalonate kinase
VQRFPAKLLLFGEYTILLGGTSLSIPVPGFFGTWHHLSEEKEATFRRQFDFAGFSQFLAGSRSIDLTGMREEIEQGWGFDSNIPIGYGLGSSGALTAAIWAHYGSARLKDPSGLREVLRGIEDFFHGSSSGVDPLVSLLKRPVLVRKDKIITDLPDSLARPFPYVGLLDSGRPRNTGILVKVFRDLIKSKEYYRILESQYFPLVEQVVDRLLRNERNDEIMDLLQQISRIQLQLFEQMIPRDVREIWQTGLESDRYLMKLCGAGGGGYFLVFPGPEADDGEDLQIPSGMPVIPAFENG